MTRSRAATTKDQYQARVDFLEERGPLWQARMGLAHIEIEHHYLDASSALLFGADVKNSPGTVRCMYGRGSGHGATYTAFVETRWNYQMADVYFMLPSVIQWDEQRLEAVLVHEYSHILCAAEQYLLEYKLEEVAAEEAMTTTDMQALAALYYERMEMATENVARAVLGAFAAGSE